MSRETETQGKKRTAILIGVLLVIAVVAVCISIWALSTRNQSGSLTPDYAPVEEDPNAEEIPGDNQEKLDQPEGGSSVSLTYSKEAEINLADNSVSLVFANPGKSNQDMVLQIVVQDEVIAQSGTIKPGRQINHIELLDGSAEKLSAGAYEGHFTVLYYNPETGEKAIVNTEIPVTLTVSE